MRNIFLVGEGERCVIFFRRNSKAKRVKGVRASTFAFSKIELKDSV